MVCIIATSFTYAQSRTESEATFSVNDDNSTTLYIKGDALLYIGKDEVISSNTKIVKVDAHNSVAKHTIAKKEKPKQKLLKLKEEKKTSLPVKVAAKTTSFYKPFGKSDESILKGNKNIASGISTNSFSSQKIFSQFKDYTNNLFLFVELMVVVTLLLIKYNKFLGLLFSRPPPVY